MFKLRESCPEGTEPEGTEPEGTEPEGTEADEGDQASRELPAAVRLVIQTEDTQAGESTESPTNEATETEPANEASETEPASDAPSGESEPAEESEPATSEASEEPSSEGDSPAATSDEKTMESSDEAGDASASEEPNVMAFEEVKDQIARSMVEETARGALDKAITAARNQMRSYYQRVAISENKDLERPDLKKLADELGLTHRVIGPHDPVSLADEPIAAAVQEGTEFSRRGMPFTAMMFGVEGQVPEQPMFRPVVFVQIETERSYLCWKTESTEAFTPELADVQDEVIDAIRMAQARKLALEAAEKIAEQANGGERLEGLIPDDKKDNYKKDIKPFTWLNTVGFAGISMGNVEELDSVGEDFMKAVFTDLDEKHAVATNLPGRVVYVIKRIEMQPTASDLRAIFKQPTERLLPQFMTDGSLRKVQQGFYESIDEKTGFEFMGLEQ